MLAPCSGIRGGPRKIARPAKCGGPGANNRVSGIWLYIGLCYGFILLYAPAFLSLLGKLWRRPRGLLVICSGRLRRPRQALGSIKSKIKWYRDEWQRTLWKIKERGTKRGQQRGVERKRGESGSSCMPENAWQESRDTGLRHLSVGVALYAGLCSGFILLYAPAFLSLLFSRQERRDHENLCQAA